jgi:hypothetical protein
MADLVTSVVIVAALGGCLPSLSRSPEQASRVYCASNLRQIGQAVILYAAANKGAYPRALFDGVGGRPTEYTGENAPDPFAAGGPGPNDVTAAMFLLVRTQGVTTDVYLCKSAGGEMWQGAGAPPEQRSNFPGRQHVTYSFANPYASPAGVGAGFKWDDSLSKIVPPDFAIAADMNPGPPAVVSIHPNASVPQLRQANSRNHNGDGQNVLYGDGRVEFQNTPFCGMLRTTNDPRLPQCRDNIYTYGAGYAYAAGTGVRGAPVDSLDSVLLPTVLDGPVPKYPLIPNRPLTWVIAGLLGVVLFCVAATIRLARRRTSPPAA